jgi:hypothetical protein
MPLSNAIKSLATWYFPDFWVWNERRMKNRGHFVLKRNWHPGCFEAAVALTGIQGTSVTVKVTRLLFVRATQENTE